LRGVLTPRASATQDFRALFANIHRPLSGDGDGKLEGFKTQLPLAGDDPVGEFLVARLVTTKPRPRDVQHAMAQTCTEMLTAAIETELRPYWWQCRVLNKPFAHTSITSRPDAQHGSSRA
jgi:hypothetical protein